MGRTHRQDRDENGLLGGIVDTRDLASLVFPEEWGTKAEREKAERDMRAYDLTTPDGRRAWKTAAPAGKVRTIAEDGEAWLGLLADTMAEQAGEWLYGRSGLDVADA